MHFRILFGPLVSVLYLLLLQGCTGTESLSMAARAGDTVALAVGWRPELKREDIRITLIPEAGTPLILSPGDPAVRAVLHLYPDPVSRLMVVRETKLDSGSLESGLAGFIELLATNGEKDYLQSTVFLDLPDTLPQGLATIEIDNGKGMTIDPITVDILGAGGTRHPFKSIEVGGVNDEWVRTLERADHYVINFTGDTIPHSMQLTFSHDPDVDTAGHGRAHIVNPLSAIKNITWSTDGQILTVLITPSNHKGSENFPNNITSLKDLRFYVTGGITGLQLPPGGLQAFDGNGEIIDGITASITPSS